MTKIVEIVIKQINNFNSHNSRIAPYDIMRIIEEEFGKVSIYCRTRFNMKKEILDSVYKALENKKISLDDYRNALRNEIASLLKEKRNIEKGLNREYECLSFGE